MSTSKPNGFFILNLVDMAENKKSFIAYSDWHGMFKALPDDIAGRLIKHVFAYVNDENPKSDDYIINALFEQIKATLKRDLQKWDKQREQRSEAGKRSAEIRSTKFNERSTSVNEKERNSTVSVSVSDSVNVSVNDINISFDLFWDLYDKKVGDKVRVEKKWNRLTNQQRDEIVKYIPKYIASQPDKQYRKHPETFLNQKGWEDEIILKKPNRGEITPDSFQVW